MAVDTVLEKPLPNNLDAERSVLGDSSSITTP